VFDIRPMHIEPIRICVTGITGIWGLLVLWHASKGLKFFINGSCITCGYDLTGLQSSSCPECNTEIVGVSSNN
jgi:hypothetical protein